MLKSGDSVVIPFTIQLVRELDVPRRSCGRTDDSPGVDKESYLIGLAACSVVSAMSDSATSAFQVAPLAWRSVT